MLMRLNFERFLREILLFAGNAKEIADFTGFDNETKSNVFDFFINIFYFQENILKVELNWTAF